MRRREFITLIGGAAVAWPLPLSAQQPGKLPTIGFLGASTSLAWSPWIAAFVQRLRELGWIEGRTVAIEYRWAEGRSERYTEIAAEFVRLKVDVILTVGSAVPAAKQATATIPIVFALAGDPVGSGLVVSLARPGSNVTGLSILSSDLAGKRIELLREVLPGLRRLAVIINAGSANAALEVAEAQTAARKLGIDVDVLEIRRAEDIVPAFGALKSGVQALYVCPDPLVNANHARINTLALGARLPTMHPFRDYLGAGGLMSYGANNADLFRRAGDYVDKILRGAKPADLPVEQPTKFDLIINLTTAKALGLTIPQSILLRSDEVRCRDSAHAELSAHARKWRDAATPLCQIAGMHRRCRCSKKSRSPRFGAAGSTRCSSTSAIAATSPACIATSTPARNRTEEMGAEVADLALEFLRRRPVKTLDITGGAPELNTHFRRVVSAARELGVRVMDRCNLTVLEQPGQEDTAEFLAREQVEIVASLPCYLEDNVNAQRGKGVFEGSIRALRKLNALGYGREGSGLTLNLVYNPQGPSLPPPQAALEADYKRILGEQHGVRFNALYTLANMPIQRFGSTLISHGTFDQYLALLQHAHQDANLDGVMCRNLISVDWRGFVYDCDFNQMLDLAVMRGGKRVHLSDLLEADIENHPIRVAGHCFGCTAGQGSSCGGALKEAAE